jgi:hypothetical protein
LIISKVDHLVDIFNGTVKNKNDEPKGCENLNSPSHALLQEVVDILSLFTEWKAEAESNKKGKGGGNFIPWQLYEDLYFMIFGMVGVAQRYLKEDESW